MFLLFLLFHGTCSMINSQLFTWVSEYGCREQWIWATAHECVHYLVLLLLAWLGFFVLFFRTKHPETTPCCPNMTHRLLPQWNWSYFRISLGKITASGLEFQVSIHSSSAMPTAEVRALKYISASPFVAGFVVWVTDMLSETQISLLKATAKQNTIAPSESEL